MVQPRVAVLGAARGQAPVTIAIIAINVLVALWAAARPAEGRFSGGELVRLDLGLFAPFLADGEWYRLITAGFAHGGILHLAFNMIVVWQFGSMLEPAIGRPRLVALYFAALLAGSAGALLMSPDALTVGASGAAFGLVGAAAIGLHRRGINIFSTGIGMMLVINLVLTFAIPGISIGGHLGGLAGGAAVGAVYFSGGRSNPGLFPSLGAAAGVIVAAVVLSLYAVAAY
jgi:membrane associated rhomboid family serine protease